AEKIQQDITAGQLKPGHLAPSEAQIVARWGVARITARKAIAVLRERGLVHTVRGKGTYVGPAREHRTTRRAPRRHRSRPSSPRRSAPASTSGTCPSRRRRRWPSGS